MSLFQFQGHCLLMVSVPFLMSCVQLEWYHIDFGDFIAVLFFTAFSVNRTLSLLRVLLARVWLALRALIGQSALLSLPPALM